jgi:hypothetical protein
MLNAAAEYRRAFACLPDSNLGTYSRYLGRDDPESELLIQRGRDALEKLHDAARCATCDWGKQAQDSVNVDDFSGARCLAMLAMLRAETSFRHGDDQTGLDDLIAVMALGRHVGQGKRVSGLAGFPIEDLAVKKAFEVLDRLDSKTRRTFAERLGCLPAFPDHASAIRGEQSYFRTNYRDVFAALDDHDDPAPSIREKFGLPETTDENSAMIDFVFPGGDPAELMLRASGGTRAGLLALADQTLSAMDSLLAIADGSETAPSEKLTTLREAAASNPLLADELRAFDKVSPIWDHFQKRVESLHTRANGE